MNLHNAINNTYSLVLSISLVLAFIALCLHYGLLWMRVGRYRDRRLPKATDVPSNQWPSVSVVIVAHNDGERLKRCLPYLLEQDYNDFEVVVVDYTSSDDTSFVLRICAENYPNLKKVSFPKDVNMFQGKKYPLSIGIQSASKDIILLTEPDTVPVGFGWIREMMRGYMHGASIVLGYRLIERQKGLFNSLQQYENIILNSNTIGMALLGNPYTATGRSLSYRRDFFFDRGGFISHYSIPYGIDDLFVNQNANSKNTSVVTTPEASVLTSPALSFRDWRLTRRFHAASRRHYKTSDRLIAKIYPLAQIIFYTALLWLWIGRLLPWPILLTVLLLKTAWMTVCNFFLCKKFTVKLLYLFSPFFEVYFLIADTISSLSALSTMRNKNR